MSEIALANVKALVDSEIRPGDSCYSDAENDADEPKAVKCGNPCVFEPLDILWFFPSTSYCP